MLGHFTILCMKALKGYAVVQGNFLLRMKTYAIFNVSKVFVILRVHLLNLLFI